MKDFTRALIKSIEDNKIEGIGDNLKLKTLSNYGALKELIENKTNPTYSPKDSIFTSASYTEGSTDLELNLTITSLKVLKKRNGEKYSRGKYYFVILSKIKFDKSDKKFMYHSSKILLNENEIQKWWISRYKTYNPKTKIIYDKYGYVPPPPPPPPPPQTPEPDPAPPTSPASAPVEGLLRDTYRNNFNVGVALSSGQTNPLGQSGEIALSQFNAMTPEFELQMNFIAPEEGVFNFDRADRIVDFGMENNLPMRGHALLWHEATPDYFLQGTRDDIRQRLDTYIGTVVEHFRDRINIWDVVNEVVSTDLFRGDAGIGPDLFTIWHDAVGNADYIDWAFEAARRADPNALLFINDFNTEEPRKLGWLIDIIRRLRERGVPIDGVGHQVHLRLETTAESVLSAIDAVDNEFLGLITHVTEMDINMYTDPGSCFETGTNLLNL